MDEIIGAEQLQQKLNYFISLDLEYHLSKNISFKYCLTQKKSYLRIV
jgi:hypothetical protein